jgi:long-chain fatty acid transport protein
MKKLLTLIFTACLCSHIFAGGIVTNVNQSASWVRMPAQDASVGISAAYYNPACIMKLNNGFHISISNQTISQSRKVRNTYAGPGGEYGLNQYAFRGKVSAPVFPSFYAVYKMEKIAFSFGFNPIGGGGGAIFDKGLPSFEMSPSDLVPSLASQGAASYKLDAYFKGYSINFGYQAGISYKINDMISVYGGVRYVTAKNTYLGHLNDVELNMGGTWKRADAVFAGIVTSLNGMLAIPARMQQIINVNAAFGGLTLAAAQGATIIDAPTRASLEAALTSIGMPTTLTIAQIQGAFSNAAVVTSLTTKKITSIATGKLLRDQGADVEQTGSGISPILGVNLTLSEKINIGIKYEFKTKIDITNKTTKDFTLTYLANGDSVTMFPDKEKISNDMPAMLSIGVSAKVIDKLTFNAGMHWYNDKGASYGKKLNGAYVKNDSVINKNYYELAAGLEYKLTDKLLVSVGGLLSKTGIKESFQSDLSYSLSSKTIGGGAAYNITDKIQVNLGAGYTVYDDGHKSFNHIFSATGAAIPTKESYSKSNFFFGVGVDLSF